MAEAAMAEEAAIAANAARAIGLLAEKRFEKEEDDALEAFFEEDHVLPRSLFPDDSAVY